LNNITILIVDDDEVLGQVMGRVLARRGYRVVRAVRAADALEMADRDTPQIALLDLCLPDGNGADLAAELSTRHPETALVLMTAIPLRRKESRDFADRFAEVLTKPVGVKEVFHAVDAALRNSPTPVTAPP
jgi:DNA-binding response OmpR family regulator